MAEFEQIYSDKQRKTKIKKEQKRLQAMLHDMAVGDSIVTTSGFYGVIIDITEDDVIVEFGSNRTLEETRQIIARDGIVETYQNGANQTGVKKSSAVEVYDKMVNTYSRVVKQLTDLIPERVIFEPEEEEDDDPAEELMAFVNGLKR